jgi:hypothetical protein
MKAGLFTQLFILAGLALAHAAPARAAVISASGTFVLGTGSFFNGSGPFAQCSIGAPGSCTTGDSQTVNVAIAKFNPALGTLSGIQVTLDSIFPLGTEVVGTGSGGTATATGVSTYDVGGLFIGSMNAPSSTCTPFCGVFTGVAGYENFDLDLTTTIAPGDFGDFIGLDSASIAIVQDITVTGTGDTGGVIARARTNSGGSQGWRGTLTFAYTYDEAPSEVPEPGTVALLAMAAGGLWAFRTRGRTARR